MLRFQVSYLRDLEDHLSMTINNPAIHLNLVPAKESLFSIDSGVQSPAGARWSLPHLAPPTASSLFPLK